MLNREQVEASIGHFVQMTENCRRSQERLRGVADGFDESAMVVPGIFDGSPSILAAMARCEAAMREVAEETRRVRQSLLAMHRRGLLRQGVSE